LGVPELILLGLLLRRLLALYLILAMLTSGIGLLLSAPTAEAAANMYCGAFYPPYDGSWSDIDKNGWSKE
jgi:hypothetical protein